MVQRGGTFPLRTPPKGRGRSFYQFNADLLGEDGVGADAELIALLVAIFETLGLGQKDFRIRLSDRLTWVCLLENLGVSESARPAVLDAIDKSERRKEEQTKEALEKAMPGKGTELAQEIARIKKIDSLEELSERMQNCEGKDNHLDRWKRMLDLLEAHGALPYVIIDLSIVRGLAYYTGFVYEAFEASGEGRALAGGGRYDHLLKKLSRRPSRLRICNR